MKRRLSSVARLMLVGCLPNVVAVAQTDGSALHLVVFVQGSVSVKRPVWSGYAPVVFGTYLRFGDLLRGDESSQAKVVCSDLTLRNVPTGMTAVPCLTDRPLLRRPGGSFINPTRGWEGHGSFPVVLSPRKTKVLSSHPLLRWTPVEGVASYRIMVRGPNLVWSKVVDSVSVNYPKDAPELKTGVDYKLIVESPGQSSASEPGLGLGFSVVGSEEKKAVAREAKKIEQFGLAEGPTEFLIAHLYASHRLYAEAIQRLEGISDSFKRSAVARVLGDLYLAIGLSRHAETAYVNYLNLSRSEGDPEGEMLAHLSLARIYVALGISKSAREHVEASLRLAGGIGDKETAGTAEKLRAGLK